MFFNRKPREDEATVIRSWNASTLSAVVDGFSGFDENTRQFADRYHKDTSAFEMGTWVLFLIDVWLVRSGKEKWRDDVLYQKILPDFFDIFREAFEVEDQRGVLNNRFTLYGKLIRTDPSQIRHFFSQLLLYSAVSEEITAYNFASNFPKLIASMDEELFLRASIVGFENTMIPVVIKNFTMAMKAIGK